MCGIAGSFGSGVASVGAMVEAMRHRGPDDRGILESSLCSLGMTRLAIVDVSLNGHQPMLWGDGLVALVFNGEIYNHHDLRRELVERGHTFRSLSDTEVVLHLYLELGEAFVERLRGMFAIALLDRREGQDRLLLARDHLGIKPLVYAQTDDGFVFASELKALLASGAVTPTLDPDSVRQLMMRGSVSQPATLLAGVRMLMPGHLMRVSSRGIEAKRFWQPGAGRRPDIAAMPYADQIDAVEAELIRIVREQMVADVPVGAFLSGGLDSSLLVALMAKAHGEPVRTFSVGFGRDAMDLDETEDAAFVARTLNTDHTCVELAASDVAGCLDTFAAGLDQPSVDGLNVWFVSEAAARSVKVAISGTGGDELFAGYPWFRTMQDYTRERAERPWWKRVAHAITPSRPSRSDFLRRFAEQYRHFDPVSGGRLLNTSPSQLETELLRDLRREDILAGSDVLSRVSGLCLAGYTQNQLLRDVDATSMAHSLEVRVPFLDPDLADIALSLPEAARLAPVRSGAPVGGSYAASGTKRILQDIARRHLPSELLDRPKRGFSLPVDAWLRGPLLERMQDTLRALPADITQVIDQGETVRVLHDFTEGRIHWGRPWLILMLALWWEAVVTPACSRNHAFA